MPEQRRYAYDLVIGHSANHLVDFCSPEAIIATILRNPVERIISHYYYVLEQPTNYLHSEVISRRMTLRDYVCAAISDEMRNYVTCSFSGMTSDEASRDPVGAVETAWATLRSRYHVVGIVERLQPAIDALRMATGIRQPWPNKQYNTTVSRPLADSISALDRQAIREHNALDMELYLRVAEYAPR
jgi:hypothetical protein